MRVACVRSAGYVQKAERVARLKLEITVIAEEKAIVCVRPPP